MEEIYGYSGVDPWFLVQIEDIVRLEGTLEGRSVTDLEFAELRNLKRKGFADKRIAAVMGDSEASVRAHRQA